MLLKSSHPFFWVFWIKRIGALFHLGLYLSELTGISEMPASSSPGSEYMGQKDKPGNPLPCCVLGPDVPQVYFSEANVYFICNVQGF